MLRAAADRNTVVFLTLFLFVDTEHVCLVYAPPSAVSSVVMSCVVVSWLLVTAVVTAAAPSLRQVPGVSSGLVWKREC